VSDSVFTKIVKGEIPAHKLYEDELTLAFLDINPVTKGHALVIPKDQIDHLDECSPEIHAAIFNTVHTVSRHMKNTLKPLRIALIVHGFEVPHAHIHLIPIYHEGQLGFPRRPDPKLDHKQLAKLAQDLRIKDR